MNVVIIGNGFDLAHGLPTRYSDFIYYYLKLKFNESKKSEIKNSPILNVKCTGSFNYDEIDWVKKAVSFTDLKKLCKNYGLSISSDSIFFQSLVIDAIHKNWVDVEYEYYYRLQNLTKNRIDKKEDILCLSSMLNNEFECLKNAFYDYIEIVNNDIKNSKYSFSDSPYIKIFKQYDLGKDGGLIINFNYTDLLNQYSKSGLLNNYISLNIHGNIKQRDSLIFGYGDDIGDSYKMLEDVNENELFKHFKTFKYLMSSEYKETNSNILNAIQFNVIVLGHSLGVSDRTLFNQIFNHSNRGNVILFHYDGKDVKQGTDYGNKVYEISRHWKNKHEMNVKVEQYDTKKIMPQINIFSHFRN